MEEKGLGAEFINIVGKVFNVDPENLSRETSFVEDLHAKSLNIYALAAFMEKMSGKKITYAEANQCASIGEAIDLMEKS